MYGFGIPLLEMYIGRRSTDDIFQDGLTLHDIVKTSLSEPVMEIMDPHLVFGGVCGFIVENWHHMFQFKDNHTT